MDWQYIVYLQFPQIEYFLDEMCLGLPFSITYAPQFDRPGLLSILSMISFNRKYAAISRDTKPKKEAGVFGKLFCRYDLDLKLTLFFLLNF